MAVSRSSADRRVWGIVEAPVGSAVAPEKSATGIADRRGLKERLTAITPKLGSASLNERSRCRARFAVAPRTLVPGLARRQDGSSAAQSLRGCRPTPQCCKTSVRFCWWESRVAATGPGFLGFEKLVSGWLAEGALSRCDRGGDDRPRGLPENVLYASAACCSLTVPQPVPFRGGPSWRVLRAGARG
jgi:hypothetical protein